MRPGRLLAIVVAALVGALHGAPAAAQFDGPLVTPVRERISGVLMSAEGAPAPEAGDQLAAIFMNEVVGLFNFSGTGDAAREFSILVYGDNTGTPAVEGPRRGQPITFRFFDTSTNTIRTDVRALNPQGEAVNVTYQGDFVIDIPGVPIDLTPTRELNMRLGAGGPGDPGGEPGIDGDVNGDGEVTKEDAAMVLRVVLGAIRAVPDDALGRADVNGDGVIDTNDAVEILRIL